MNLPMANVVRVSKDGKESKTNGTSCRAFYACHIGLCFTAFRAHHQIRVHGLSIGHPLVGDDKYGHELNIVPNPRRLRVCMPVFGNSGLSCN